MDGIKKKAKMTTDYR